jgi:hypothetical protein
MASTAVTLVIVLLLMAMANHIPERWIFIVIIMKVFAIAKMIIYGAMGHSPILALMGLAMGIYVLLSFLKTYQVNKLMSYKTQMILQYGIFSGALLYILI